MRVFCFISVVNLSIYISPWSLTMYCANISAMYFCFFNQLTQYKSK
ncbi:hypothetical protein OIU79_006381 [Salix purpurea]|uniref:Uncharacterized protein n=1 Tax=Salix purpurea TaxID=77065 RepID=A0A9Q0TV94_SALPP|nr:hypothetical protein OIU79_006381 [Salix purpurea]